MGQSIPFIAAAAGCPKAPSDGLSPLPGGYFVPRADAGVADVYHYLLGQLPQSPTMPPLGGTMKFGRKRYL